MAKTSEIYLSKQNIDEYFERGGLKSIFLCLQWYLRNYSHLGEETAFIMNCIEKTVLFKNICGAFLGNSVKPLVSIPDPIY